MQQKFNEIVPFVSIGFSIFLSRFEKLTNKYEFINRIFACSMPESMGRKWIFLSVAITSNECQLHWLKLIFFKKKQVDAYQCTFSTAMT